MEKTREDILLISKLPGVEIEGIFTHFASADEENADYTLMQYERFMGCIEKLEKMGVKNPCAAPMQQCGVGKISTDAA